MNKSGYLLIGLFSTTLIAAPGICRGDKQASAKQSAPEAQAADPKSLSWSLPIAGQMKLGTMPNGKTAPLSATISVTDAHSPITARVGGLMESAISRDQKVAEYEAATAKYSKLTSKLIAAGKDATQFCIHYQGFGPSIEASNIILGESLKVRSKSSAEFARQKQIDEIHGKVVSSMMQVAMGMGMTDRRRGEEVSASGYQSLKQLVGEKQAGETMAMLSQWKEDLEIPEGFYLKEPWDVTTKQTKMDQVMAKSLYHDQVITGIADALHKYNKKSKLNRVSAQVIQTSLGIVAGSPTFAGPAAKAALVGYVLATGGSEENKLLKQVYLDKRLESRCKLLNDEAHLAVDNYQLGILTRNPLLIALSESLIQEMTDTDTTKDVLGTTIWATDKTAAQPPVGKQM